MRPPLPPSLLLCLLFLPLLLAALTGHDWPQRRIELSKCCWMSEYLELDGWKCVTLPWSNPNFTWEADLEPPVAALWVPPPLRNLSIHARYKQVWWGDRLAVLNADNATLLAEVLRANASAGVFAAEELFDPPVDERAAWAQSFCFDSTGDADLPNVLITGLHTRRLHKCCPEGQRLNADADGCEWVAGRNGEGGEGGWGGEGGEDTASSGDAWGGERGGGGNEDGGGSEGGRGSEGGSGSEGGRGSEGGGSNEGVGTVRGSRDVWDDGNFEGGEGRRGGGDGWGDRGGEGDGNGGDRWGDGSGDVGGVGEADWRPPSPLAQARGLQMDVMEVWDWNVAVSLGEGGSGEGEWRLLARPGVEALRVWVRGPRLEGETGAFCFDAVAKGPLGPRVLLAVVAQARKCCGRGQRLSGDAQSCEGGQGPVGAEAGAGRVGEEDARAAPWLPAALLARLNLSSSARVAVEYAASWGLARAVLLDADDTDAWGVEPEKGWGVGLAMGVRLAPLVPGAVVRWCVDERAGGGRVLAVDVSCLAAGVRCLPKCCPSGRLLVAGGRCGAPATPTRDWDPMRSGAAALLAGPGVRAVARFDAELPCGARALGRVEPPPEELAQRLARPEEWLRHSNVYHCADFLLDEGVTREALASCELPGVAGVYARVRPLQAVAVGLLALGIVSLLSQLSTRTTVHGWALASHAACLLAANALQVIWFFTHQRGTGCQNYAFAIYYFLVAAGVWLNVVSINIVRGFRQPLGARSAGGAGGQSRALMRQLAAWSAYGWGCPAVFTAVAVSMFWDRKNVEQAGYASPTFFETRTCLLEDRLFSFEEAEERKNTGAIFYYYIPMSVLAMANAACLAFTIFIIWKWKKATAMVQNIGSSTGATKGGLQDALLYVKLLLSAGVAELALEITVWASRPTKWDDDSWLTRYNSIMHSIYVFNMVATLVDVLRALAVLWLSAGRCAWAAQAARLALRTLRVRAPPQTQELPRAQRLDSDWGSVDTTTTTTTGC